MYKVCGGAKGDISSAWGDEAEGGGIQEEIPQEVVILLYLLSIYRLNLDFLLNPWPHPAWLPTTTPRIWHTFSVGYLCLTWLLGNLILAEWSSFSLFDRLLSHFNPASAPNSGGTCTVLIWALGRDFDFGFSWGIVFSDSCLQSAAS